MKYKKIIFTLPLLVLLSGCETTRQRQQSDARRHAASRHAEERAYRVQGQVESVEMENARLMQELQQLRHDIHSYNGQMAQLNSKMNALETKQSREMNELIKRVEGLLKKSVASRPSSKPNRGSGREHVVESGHTLSAIAQAYGVSVKSIKKGNNLKSDSIYVGQKLFIPE